MGRTVRFRDLFGTEVANACESLIEAVYLGRPNRCEEAVDETRRCPKGQLDAGLGKTPLRMRKSQEPGGSMNSSSERSRTTASPRFRRSRRSMTSKAAQSSKAARFSRRP